MPSTYLATKTVLYVSGLATDIAMDSGDGVSHGVPICESYTLHHATLRLAGRDFTFLQRGRLLGMSRRNCLRHRAQIDCGINKDKTYELQDGNINIYCAERFRCVDFLFQPSFIGEEASGSFLTKCCVDTRKKLCADVVLSRGTTIFRGMVERMTNELTALARSTMTSRWLLRFDMDWRMDLVNELPDRNIISVAWKCYSRQASLLTKASGATPLFGAAWNATFKELYANVVLSSGTTMFLEIVERVTNELTSLASFTTKIKVVAPIRYGLDDFSCLLSASSRSGPRRASTRNPAHHRPQLCLRISVQQLFLRLIHSLSFTGTLLTLLATLMSSCVKKKKKKEGKTATSPKRK